MGVCRRLAVWLVFGTFIFLGVSFFMRMYHVVNSSRKAEDVTKLVNTEDISSPVQIVRAMQTKGKYLTVEAEGITVNNAHGGKTETDKPHNFELKESKTRDSKTPRLEEVHINDPDKLGTKEVQTIDSPSAASDDTHNIITETLPNTFRQVATYLLGKHAHIEANPETWIPLLLPNHLQGAEQTNPELIKYIRDHWIIPPSLSQTWNLTNPEEEHNSQFNQSQFFDAFFERKRGGFFIEAGAFDGETFSNTLFFERFRGWTGLLVEANPDVFRSLLWKRRLAYKVNACLSPTTKAMVANFSLVHQIGGIVDYVFRDIRQVSVVSMQCLPLYSILAALGAPPVDLFSLDIEGPEVEVLQSLPIDQLAVRTYSVETKVDNDWAAYKEKWKKVEMILAPHGYRKIQTPFHIDVVFNKT